MVNAHHTCWYRDARQAAAMNECATAYARHTAGYRETRQACATFERVIAYARYTVGYRDIDHFSVTRKPTTRYRSHRQTCMNRWNHHESCVCRTSGNRIFRIAINQGESQALSF
jgi:hypothetical protein